jgi:hypothetical protein
MDYASDARILSGHALPAADARAKGARRTHEGCNMEAAMVTRPSLLLVLALSLAAPTFAHAACDIETISRKLRLAEQARFWSNFWEELDERERRVELLRARFLYDTVRKLMEDPGCAGEQRLERRPPWCAVASAGRTVPSGPFAPGQTMAGSLSS